MADRELQMTNTWNSREPWLPFVKQFASRQWLPTSLLAFGVAYWWHTVDLPFLAVMLPHAAIVCLGVMVFGGAMADVVSWRRGIPLKPSVVPSTDLPEEKDATDAEVRRRWYRSGGIGMLMIVYIYLMPRLGFHETSAIFIALGFKILGVRRLTSIGVLVVATVASSYLFFSVALGIQLPEGPVTGALP